VGFVCYFLASIICVLANIVEKKTIFATKVLGSFVSKFLKLIIFVSFDHRLRLRCLKLMRTLLLGRLK